MENAQHIVLRGKHDDYIFAEQNAEFLKTYNTDDKQIDYYTNLAMRVFEEFKIDGDFEFDGVRTNVSVWFNNKRKQIELLRHHPYWSEEAKAVIFLQTETRGIDMSRAVHVLGDMFYFVARDMSDHPKTSLLGAIQVSMQEMNKGDPPIVTDAMIAKITERVKNVGKLPKQIRSCLNPGCRITKLVRKSFEFMELESGEVINATTIKTDDNSFDKIYARFSDLLSELTVEKITLLSVHFNDFMLMSNGNSWSSCHYINSHNIFHEGTGQSVRGEYKQGCLSYALDAPSMILYTLPASYDGNEYYRCQKMTRMCCQYENGALVTGKCYPNNEDGLITRYRNILQQVLSQCGGFPNLWTFSKNTSKIAMFARTAPGSAHYPDYEYDKQKPTVSLCRSITLDLDNPMTVGNKAYCLYCSKEIGGDRKSWLQCRDHEIRMTCAVCGRRIRPGEEHHDIDGKKYCNACTFFCTWHKRNEPVTEKHKASAGGQICNSAAVEMATAIAFDEIGLTITKPRSYRAGDYVLMMSDVSQCTYSASREMRMYYPNRIVKITSVSNSGRAYGVSNLDQGPLYHSWTWSDNCFAGVVIGATDEHIGKTIGELRKELTHET